MDVGEPYVLNLRVVVGHHYLFAQMFQLSQSSKNSSLPYMRCMCW